MELRVDREPSDDKSTIGALYIDGVFECWTLEDPVREFKIFAQTAIPAGRYKVIIDQSVHFKNAFLPHILDVPNFSGVRIHIGNTDSDTEGCILIGQTRGTDFIGMSGAAMAAFFPKLQAGLLAGDVWITIK